MRCFAVNLHIPVCFDHLISLFWQFKWRRNQKQKRWPFYLQCLWLTNQIVFFNCCKKMMLHSIMHSGFNDLPSLLFWSEFQKKKKKDWIFGKPSWSADRTISEISHGKVRQSNMKLLTKFIFYTKCLGDMLAVFKIL